MRTVVITLGPVPNYLSKFLRVLRQLLPFLPLKPLFETRHSLSSLVYLTIVINVPISSLQQFEVLDIVHLTFDWLPPWTGTIGRQRATVQRLPLPIEPLTLLRCG
jgi:hypothetical protein